MTPLTSVDELLGVEDYTKGYDAGRIADSLGVEISSKRAEPQRPEEPVSTQAGRSFRSGVCDKDKEEAGLQCVTCDDDDGEETEACLRRHFTCKICFQPRWSDETSALALSCCNQLYCGDCWAGWVRTRLEGGATRLEAGKVCPTPGCPQRPDQQMREELHQGMTKLCAGLLTCGEKRDLHCLCVLDKDPTARRCPRCFHPTSRRIGGHGLSRSDDPLAMQCEREDCGFIFCASHGDLHPDETCREYCARVPLDPERVAFARKNHTRRCPDCRRGIVKNGGCDHMRCICGSHFNWSSAEVEVPCNCFNLRDPRNGRIVPWGAAPCPGASGAAHLKLAAWRALVGTAASPVLATALVVASPFIAFKASTALWKDAQQFRALRARARGLRPGTFEYNFLVYGEGRKRR